MITIDISGPDGNAYALMGYAETFAGNVEMSTQETEEMLEMMMEGDYANLLNIFNQYWGSYVKLVGREDF